MNYYKIKDINEPFFWWTVVIKKSKTDNGIDSWHEPVLSF